MDNAWTDLYLKNKHSFFRWKKNFLIKRLLTIAIAINILSHEIISHNFFVKLLLIFFVELRWKSCRPISQSNALVTGFFQKTKILKKIYFRFLLCTKIFWLQAGFEPATLQSRSRCFVTAPPKLVETFFKPSTSAFKKN